MFCTSASFICEGIFNDRICEQNEIPRASHPSRNFIYYNLKKMRGQTGDM